jgi:hypothetical protein
MCVIVQGELGVRNSVRLVRLPCDKYVKTTADRLGILACNDCKLCKSVTVLYLIVVTICGLLINSINNLNVISSHTNTLQYLCY